MYVVIQNSTKSKSYMTTDDCNKPYLELKDGARTPLTTNTTNGFYINVKSSSSHSESASYLTSDTESSGMSSVTALTSEVDSSYSTSAVSSEGMSSTTALTRESTSGYLTRSSTSGYGTVASKSSMTFTQSELQMPDPYTSYSRATKGNGTVTSISYRNAGGYVYTYYQGSYSGTYYANGNSYQSQTFTIYAVGGTLTVHGETLSKITETTATLTCSSTYSTLTCESTSGYSGVSSSSSASTSAYSGYSSSETIIINSAILRPKEYNTASESYSYTALTSGVDPSGMSSTTALTSEVDNTYYSSKVDSAGLSSTTALTRSSLVRTEALTSSQITGYGTKSTLSYTLVGTGSAWVLTLSVTATQVNASTSYGTAKLKFDGGGGAGPCYAAALVATTESYYGRNVNAVYMSMPSGVWQSYNYVYTNKRSSSTTTQGYTQTTATYTAEITTGTKSITQSSTSGYSGVSSSSSVQTTGYTGVTSSSSSSSSASWED